MTRPKAQWRIYRFELVYFDPEFQRWQLFQEGTGHSSGHRGHIESLLNSLRDVFSNVPRGSPFDLAKDDDEKPIEISLTPEWFEWMSNGCDADKVWENFISAVEASARRDGILDSPARDTQACSRTIGDLLSAMKGWRERRNPGTFTFALIRPDARNLISLLPILPHWDLYGAIRHAWAPQGRELLPSLWQEVGSLREPHYCNHFAYSDSEDSTLKSRSKDLLGGYRVSAEALFADLAEPAMKPSWIHPRDYFDYAYSPQAEELAHYRIYALLLDNLQRALAAPETDGAQDVYYLAYPVFSGLGRRHFFHVYVSPGGFNASVEDLWLAWQHFHSRLNWPDLRHLLIDELEQVDLSRFQGRVVRDLKTFAKERSVNPKRKALIRSEQCRSVVADYLHLLFPVRCACSDQAYGLYQVDSRRKNDCTSTPWYKLEARKRIPQQHREALSCEGRIGNSKTCECTIAVVPGEGPVMWDEHLSVEQTPVQSHIAQGRRQRLVQQQLEFAGIIWDSQEGTRQQALVDNKNLWKERKSILLSNKREILNALHNAQGQFKKRFSVKNIRHLLERPAYHFFKPFFFQEYLDATAEESWEAAYREVARASLHSLISEYLETGIVRWLTHSADREVPPTMTREEAKVLHNAIVKCVLTAFPTEGEAFAELKRTLEELTTKIHSALGAKSESIEACYFNDTDTRYCDIHSNRNAFRPDIGPNTGNIRPEQFCCFPHELTCTYINEESVTLNLPTPAFGIRLEDWTESVKRFCTTKSSGLVPLVVGFSGVDCSDRKIASSLHRQAATCTRVYMLLGTQTASSNTRDVPKRFVGLKDLLSPLGDVYWLRQTGSRWSLYDLIEKEEEACPEQLTDSDTFKALTKEWSALEFFVLAVDRYKVLGN